MKTSAIQKTDWRGVFAVPPLARHRDAARSINWEASGKIAAHIHKGGVTRLLYGGNAFFYHCLLFDLCFYLHAQSHCGYSDGPTSSWL